MLQRRIAVMGSLCALGLASVSASGQAVFNEEFKLVPSDGVALDDFGFSVAVSGTTAIVGSRLHGANGARSGAAYTYNTATGVEVYKFLASDGVANDEFGTSVATAGMVAAVGAPMKDDAVLGNGVGAVYLYDTILGTQTAKLLPSDGATGWSFGKSVAVEGNLVVVGAPGADGIGAVYVFDATTGVELRKITPTLSTPAPFAQIGSAVALSGDTLLAGAPADRDGAGIGVKTGSVYVFNVNTGVEIRRLLPMDRDDNDQFGGAVALQGATAVIGAIGDDDNGTSSGAAYIFNTGGAQRAKLVQPAAAGGDNFGRSVAVEGQVVVVGAWKQDRHFGSSSGAVYVYKTESPVSAFAELVGFSTEGNDLLGSGVAIDGDTIVVGAPGDETGSPSRRTGSAFVFEAPPDCRTDWDGNGVINAADVGAYLSDYYADLANGTTNADFDENGVTNAADVGEFLSAHGASTGGSCP